MQFLEQYRPHLVKLGANAESKYHHLCQLLGEIRDAVHESSDDPLLSDYFNRQSVIGLNGTKELGIVPPGEMWILDYVSASVAGWTLGTSNFVVLWSTVNNAQNYNNPVFLPGDHVIFVTTAPTDAMVQFTRRPVEKKPPYQARTGPSTEHASSKGIGPLHESQRDIIDVPTFPPHPAGVPSVA